MLTSTITFYKNIPLDNSKNYVVEGITDFLESYTSSTVTGFQFLDLKKDLVIKLNLSQYNLDYNNTYNYNYCFIEIVDDQGTDSGDDDTEWAKGIYYFITNKKWLGVDTVEMTLTMDVLNSFTWNSDYIIDGKTLILRQHKDRFDTRNALHYSLKGVLTAGESSTWYISDYFIQNTTVVAGTQPTYTVVSGGSNITSVTITMATTSEGVKAIKVIIYGAATGPFELDIKYTPELAVFKVIDLKSEGINAPLYKVSDINIEEQSNVSWSLLYRNRQNPDPDSLVNPVDCFLYPDQPLQGTVPSGSNEIDIGDLPLDKYAIIFAAYNSPVPTFFFDGGDTGFTPTQEYAPNTLRLKAIAFYNDGSHIQVYKGNFQHTKRIGNIPEVLVGDWYGPEQIDLITLDTAIENLYYFKANSLPTVNQIYSLSYYNAAWATSHIALSGISYVTIDSIDSIDRTDAKNIKLITLPYCPSSYSITGSQIVFKDTWKNSGSSLVLEDLNTKFKNTIISEIPSLDHYMLEVINDPDVMSGWTYRELEDPKLLHSDYFRPKFVYDSFAKEFDLERFDWAAAQKLYAGYYGPGYSEDWDSVNKSGNFQFDFVTSRNIVSKFLFIFNEYMTGQLGAEDYDNILPVARNNEQVLYNSQYLNYLRAGYNYDLKAKERTEVAGGVGIGLSIASLIGSIALTASGYGSGVGVAGIVGSMAGLAGSLVSYTKSVAQNEDNMQRKLIELQNQGTSVLNADDYDLLEAYSGNVAKYCEYSVSERMKKALSDLFYYCGYIVNEQGVPNISSRMWFNFVQAELVISSWRANMREEVKEAIIDKFSEGVTFFHEVDDIGDESIIHYWNLVQDRENVEVWMPDLV